MARAYDVTAVERKWQRHWDDEGTYQIDNDDPREKFYALCMYPYPSGAAHQGHVRNYTFGDLAVRYQTMQGKGVLSPIGFDSFGLPAENAAIRTGTHPRIFTDARIAELTSSLRRLGAVYDWRREIHSHDPSYINGTSSSSSASGRPAWPIGRRPRSTGAPAARPCWPTSRSWPTAPATARATWSSKRDLEQWFFRITQYADELLEALDDLEWPERAKTMQRNWIGRSEGAEFDLAGRGSTPDVTAPGVHDPARHQFRHDVRRHGARAPAGRRADDRGAAGRRRGAAPPGRCRRPTSSAWPRATPGARQARRLHRQPRHQPLHRRSRAALRGRLRADGLRHRGDHGCAGRGRARLGLRQLHGLPIVRTVQPPDGLGGERAAGHTRARASRSTAASSTASTSSRRRPGPSTGSRSGASASARSTTACATGWSHASASGAAHPGRVLPRSRRGAGARGPAARSWRPTTWSSCPPGSPRSRSTRAFSTPPAPSAAGPPVARRTPWTPSSTPRGTSCASATRGTPSSRSTPSAARGACPSISTSAALSTPSCTCSTPASSPGR